MQAVRVRHYIARASEFYKTMSLLRDDDDYLNACALLAIHSAVSFTDALRSGLGDEALSGEDHRQAAEVLRRLISNRSPRAESGIERFNYLISKKSLVAYGSRRLEAKDYQKLIVAAERYANWANTVGVELKIEGWTNDGE